MKVVLACMLLVVLGLARAQAPATAPAGALTPTPATPAIALTQRLGARLPLDAAFTDSTGRALRLADMFDGRRPAIVVLGYYHCPQLCGLVTQGLLEAARATQLPAASWRFVFASIDPTDTPGDAATRRQVALAYARSLDGDGPAAPPPQLDFLVGPPASIGATAQAIGMRYQATPMSAAAFAHPAGIVIATPDGRVSRYQMGVRFDPVELRDALVEAGGGHIGTFTERLALMCAHVDPSVGRWSQAVLVGMRVAGLSTIALVAVAVWRRRKAR